jgi:hypothetical protein
MSKTFDQELGQSFQGDHRFFQALTEDHQEIKLTNNKEQAQSPQAMLPI